MFGFIVETLSLSCSEIFEMNFKHWMRVSQRQVSVGISLAVVQEEKGFFFVGGWEIEECGSHSRSLRFGSGNFAFGSGPQ